VLVGIHRMVLREGVAAADFERLVAEEVLPAAADTPGSINRGGQSSIKSLHLLQDEGQYLWLVKSSGAFSPHLFARVFAAMYDEARQRLDRLVTLESSVVFSVVDSFDAGPRDQMGRPTGLPQRGTDL
jgi:hypothetical protein